MFKTRDANVWQREFPVGFLVEVSALNSLFINIFHDVVVRMQRRCVIKAKHAEALVQCFPRKIERINRQQDMFYHKTPKWLVIRRPDCFEFIQNPPPSSDVALWPPLWYLASALNDGSFNFTHSVVKSRRGKERCQARKTVWSVNAGRVICRSQNHLYRIINHNKHTWGCFWKYESRV